MNPLIMAVRNEAYLKAVNLFGKDTKKHNKKKVGTNPS